MRSHCASGPQRQRSPLAGAPPCERLLDASAAPAARAPICRLMADQGWLLAVDRFRWPPAPRPASMPSGWAGLDSAARRPMRPSCSECQLESFDAIPCPTPPAPSGTLARQPADARGGSPRRHRDLVCAATRRLLEGWALAQARRRLGYATCPSIRENGELVTALTCGPPQLDQRFGTSALAHAGRGDGFYAAVLQAPAEGSGVSSSVARCVGASTAWLSGGVLAGSGRWCWLAGRGRRELAPEQSRLLAALGARPVWHPPVGAGLDWLGWAARGKLPSGGRNWFSGWEVTGLEAGRRLWPILLPRRWALAGGAGLAWGAASRGGFVALKLPVTRAWAGTAVTADPSRSRACNRPRRGASTAVALESGCCPQPTNAVGELGIAARMTRTSRAPSEVPCLAGHRPADRSPLHRCHQSPPAAASNHRVGDVAVDHPRPRSDCGACSIAVSRGPLISSNGWVHEPARLNHGGIGGGHSSTAARGAQAPSGRSGPSSRGGFPGSSMAAITLSKPHLLQAGSTATHVERVARAGGHVTLPR